MTTTMLSSAEVFALSFETCSVLLLFMERARAHVNVMFADEIRKFHVFLF